MTADRSRNWTMREPQPALWDALAPAVLRVTWRCRQRCVVSNPQRLPDMEMLDRWRPVALGAFANSFTYTAARHEHELVLRAPADAVGAALQSLTAYLRKNFPHAQVNGLEIAAHAPAEDDGAASDDALAISDL